MITLSTLIQDRQLWIDDAFVSDPETLFGELVSGIDWDERLRARKAASFGLPYNYSGIVWPATSFPSALIPVRNQVAERLGYLPDNCLAHYYPDGNSNMGLHSDATDQLVPGTGIAVVSLGAERVITFRHKEEKQWEERFLLRSGSLLFMCPEMQFDWRHGILKDDGVTAGRISLTFRAINNGQLEV